MEADIRKSTIETEVEYERGEMSTVTVTLAGVSITHYINEDRGDWLAINNPKSDQTIFIMPDGTFQVGEICGLTHDQIELALRVQSAVALLNRVR